MEFRINFLISLLKKVLLEKKNPIGISIGIILNL